MYVCVCHCRGELSGVQEEYLRVCGEKEELETAQREMMEKVLCVHTHTQSSVCECMTVCVPV